MTDGDPAGPCAVCGATTPADGVAGGIQGGRLLCADCAGDPVTFEALCLECDWTYTHHDTEMGRHQARTLVQSEANSHGTATSIDSDDGPHTTVWRELDRERDGDGTGGDDA